MPNESKSDAEVILAEDVDGGSLPYRGVPIMPGSELMVYLPDTEKMRETLLARMAAILKGEQCAKAALDKESKHAKR